VPGANGVQVCEPVKPSHSHSSSLPIALLYTAIHLPIHYNQTIPTHLPAIPETAAIELLLLPLPHRHSHRILQFKSWLSNSRARRPSCSTRRRSTLQRLLPMRKRMARMASTLAADLRRPVAIPRDTVSLPLSAAVTVTLFFPSFCPSTAAERGYLQTLLLYPSIFTSSSAFLLTHSLFLPSFLPFLPAAQPARMQ
jgi:hypothetical protein